MTRIKDIGYTILVFTIQMIAIFLFMISGQIGKDNMFIAFILLFLGDLVINIWADMR